MAAVIVRRLLASLAVGLVVVSSATGAGGVDGAREFTFYPQAGLLWRDLYPNNFVDLDPGPGLQDYACGTQTYDGHTGTDSDIRSFREMDIGVPVFAALAGEVISVQDGQFDRNHGPTSARFDNHVVLLHGTGRYTIYGHLRKGIKLGRGDRVVAGQQLGWTASSGNSTWPHLHFTSQVGRQIHEPFSGECNVGESGWREQVEYPTDAYARDFALSGAPMTGRRDLPFDEAVRTGTFVRGRRTVHARVELGGAFRPGAGLLRIRFLDPGGTQVAEAQANVAPMHGRAYWRFAAPLQLSALGTWQVVVDLDGTALVDARFRVVTSSSRVRNRPPSSVSVELRPMPPTPRSAVECRLRTSLTTEDPDFEIVRYRYRWTVGGKLVRAVRSAALTDVLREGVAVSGKEVRCSVTPSDGKLSGRTSAASAVSR